MPVTLKAADQLYTRRDGHVLSVQLWSGFPGNRYGLVTAVDGRVVINRPLRGRSAQAEFCKHGTGISANATPLTADEAREQLRTVTGNPDKTCTWCEVVLPVAAPWCPACHKPQNGER